MSLSATPSRLYDAALALFYPQSCAVCGASVESRFDGVACAPCWTETRSFSSADALCWKCGTPARVVVPDNKREQVRCRRCDDKAFDAARACGVYEGAWRASVIALKTVPHVPRRVLEIMQQNFRQAPLQSANLIVPVPLHPERERQRGFNQAAVLAQKLSHFAGLNIDAASLIRTLPTQIHRAGMDARMRSESVAGAFAICPGGFIADSHILLVDDVYTTGATVSACAAVLKEAGARSVTVLTLARLREEF